MNAQSPALKKTQLPREHRISYRALEKSDVFESRHIGPDEQETGKMLEALGFNSLEALIAATVPASIAFRKMMDLPEAMTEAEALQALKLIMTRNSRNRSFIGLGYYPTFTPSVILRNVLENPGWYTAYTPYQSEISQGRLECLLNFQQMVIDLTAMELANASLLDEATAAAEGMALAKRVSKNASNLFFVDSGCFPQTIDVLVTRARCFGFELIIASPDELEKHDVFGAVLQYPSTTGAVSDLTPAIAELHAKGAIAVVAADLLALTILSPPGEMGADVVVGSCQRFGVPMGYGGPHAAYFATRDHYKRAVPGRIIGVTRDTRGKLALRMAMQTREQHIRRDKANSNICTAQVLLANIATLYAMYHGPEGLRQIAMRVNRLTEIIAMGLRQQGVKLVHDHFFDTLTFHVSAEERQQILDRAEFLGINLRLDQCDRTLGFSLDECSTEKDAQLLWEAVLGDRARGLSVNALDEQSAEEGWTASIPAGLQRFSPFLQHPNFNSCHSETDMLRLLKRLENKDISLCHSMIPLGSCTMKLNASTEMIPLSWPEISSPHPFVPIAQAQGYRQLITSLEEMLKEITGYDAISMQPNSGAQGEYAGLLAIRNYLESTGQGHRNICLIPSSAHGTNPASALMIGMKVVVVECDSNGNIDQDDLRLKANMHRHKLAALMITYPSTHGVYEEGIRDICATVHRHGGQVYLDGANMNALVGVARPGDIGADVSHVNLHKTFCIPHGGGGPGMGPIGVKAHLAPHLPNHSLIAMPNIPYSNTAVSAAPWGSASILPISWMYISMMGAEGLLKATQMAILNANYIARRLSPHYDVLYTGRNGMVAHECIIDLRPLKSNSGISEEDVAKRLMDFGYHAPTMSFPVPGTLMIEPTESESKAELDRFIEAMLIIRSEIAKVASGELDVNNNPLKNAPHTLADIMDEAWDRPYSKNQAAFPAAWLRDNKYWPSVNRVDNVFGDRNLYCSCPPVEDYR